MSKEIVVEVISEDHCKINGVSYCSRLCTQRISSITTVRATQCERCEIEEKAKIPCKDMWEKVCLKLKCSSDERKAKTDVFYKRSI